MIVLRLSELSVYSVCSWHLTCDIVVGHRTTRPQLRGSTTLAVGVSGGRRDGEKQAAVENRGKRPLEPLTFSSCLKSSSCSTENQSIQVLISNQKSVVASLALEQKVVSSGLKALRKWICGGPNEVITVPETGVTLTFDPCPSPRCNVTNSPRHLPSGVPVPLSLIGWWHAELSSKWAVCVEIKIDFGFHLKCETELQCRTETANLLQGLYNNLTEMTNLACICEMWYAMLHINDKKTEGEVNLFHLINGLHSGSPAECVPPLDTDGSQAVRLSSGSTMSMAWSLLPPHYLFSADETLKMMMPNV
ncbi:hypothetical protein F2P81_004798 [Scophthalmus maximus]|uniref:Uncharacterized protein n=1 Tax=Scophthalmus maximus TaxID=52904 RepID=A0A6A4TKT8_SCOMX|nr:hypothetical protein F2P81_004798 [Scophthalmus maximus]